MDPREFLLRLNEDGLRTHTSHEQARVEAKLTRLFPEFAGVPLHEGTAVLKRAEHIRFLKRGLRSLGRGYQCLDASRPWIVYWVTHALDMLQALPADELERNEIADFIGRCQGAGGGFGGGPGQLPHLATTYAAVNSLVILGTSHAYATVDRVALRAWLMSLKHESGGFHMHHNGEVDVRACYTALAAASLMDVLTPELCAGVGDYVLSCQTYEGGIAGVPGSEAHGGYTFCGLAAMVILGEAHRLNLKALHRWAAARQMKFEGGFQGRTNKLVDGCYSFWQGGLFPLLDTVLDSATPLQPEARATGWTFDQHALLNYVLVCCQARDGGLIDKPGKPRDYYHTCYCLSGIAAAQHSLPCDVSPHVGGWRGSAPGAADADDEVAPCVGIAENVLAPTHVVHNITRAKVRKVRAHWRAQE